MTGSPRRLAGARSRQPPSQLHTNSSARRAPLYARAANRAAPGARVPAPVLCRLRENLDFCVWACWRRLLAFRSGFGRRSPVPNQGWPDSAVLQRFAAQTNRPGRRRSLRAAGSQRADLLRFQTGRSLEEGPGSLEAVTLRSAPRKFSLRFSSSRAQQLAASPVLSPPSALSSISFFRFHSEPQTTSAQPPPTSFRAGR